MTRRLDIPVSSAGDLIALLPARTGSVVFVTDGLGLAGWGAHAMLRVTGPDAAARIEHWFSQQTAMLTAAGDPGPVCVVSLGFAPDDESVAVIPEVLINARADGVFLTRIGRGNAAELATEFAATGPTVEPEPVTAPGEVRYSDSELSIMDFMAAVAIAVDRIRAGQAAKVVLAHGLTARTQFPVDERFVLARLAERYPSCSVYAVDGLVGASPELLMRRRGKAITSRVLAGTAWPEHSGAKSGSAASAGDIGATMHRVAADLLTSAKDLVEHDFAVRSVVDALEPVTEALTVPDAPQALELANLTHLATDITGALADAENMPSALALAARLHPTAAVGGTPTDVAQSMIAELERAPRGRYAAPVGWIDARGDGEFAIALRCAQVDGHTVTMVAGCGIVAGSDPGSEAREAQIKMLPIRDALEG